jgi:hypothetical protein
MIDTWRRLKVPCPAVTRHWAPDLHLRFHIPVGSTLYESNSPTSSESVQATKLGVRRRLALWPNETKVSGL